MLRLAADEDLNNDVIRGAQRRNPDVDIVRVQDAGLSGADDGAVLEWAARDERVLLTQDANTMTRQAYERVREGRPMPGLIVVGHGMPVGTAIDDVLLLAELSFEGEWEGQVRYLPLR